MGSLSNVRALSIVALVTLTGCGAHNGLLLSDDCCHTQDTLHEMQASFDTTSSRLEQQPLGSDYLDRRRQVSDRATAEHKMFQVRRIRNEGRVADQDERQELVEAFETRFSIERN